MIINDQMPEYCTQRSMKLLNRHKKSLNGAKVLLLGVAYKQDIDDYRESPALRVMDRLKAYGADITVYDPYVRSFTHDGQTMHSLETLSAETLAGNDLVIVTTAHTTVDYSFVAEHAKLVFDTKTL